MIGAVGVLVAVLILCGGCGEEAPVVTQAPAPAAPAPDARRTIAAVGDSLTEGLGVDEADAYPARLERRLRAAGHDYRVVNAGISGETSSGALSRIDWILKTLAPDIVILETGANDGLRGIDPAVTEKNIDAIVRRLKGENITVVLAGMQMVGNLGQVFTAAFADIYPAVAGRHGVILIPFFLEGVAGDPAVNQADGIHPTAGGYARVVDTVYPYAVGGRQASGQPQIISPAFDRLGIGCNMELLFCH